MPTDSFDTGPLNFVQDRTCTIYGPCMAKEKKKMGKPYKEPVWQKGAANKQSKGG